MIRPNPPFLGGNNWKSRYILEVEITLLLVSKPRRPMHCSPYKLTTSKICCAVKFKSVKIEEIRRSLLLNCCT